jgi:hypothetical protein
MPADEFDRIMGQVMGPPDDTNLYFAELDHKYNTRKMTDGERTVIGIRRMEGKRLMLHAPQRKGS